MRPDSKPNAVGSPSISQMEPKDASEALVAIAKFGSMCWSPFFAEGTGCWYYRYAIVPLIAMLGLVKDVPPLMAFIPTWLIFLVGKRRVPEYHSQARGPSRLRHIVRSERLALVLEPFVVFAIGVTVAHYSEPFSQFCIFGAICMLVELAVRVHQIHVYRIHLRDVEAEMDHLNRLRRGDRGW